MAASEGALVGRARHLEALDALGDGGGKGNPCLHYFSFAGRGELTRLIAAAGGLEIDEEADNEDKFSFGSPGSLPTLAHGRLKIAQSFAIESYIASISPAFTMLEPTQRAIDGMFCKIKEDVLRGLSDILQVIAATESEQKATAAAKAAPEIEAICDKWLPVLNARLPDNGFINALDMPTPADLAVYNIVESFMPFKAAYRIGGYDVAGKFPKLAAHALRVAEQPAVKGFLEKSTSTAADPFGLTELARPSTGGQGIATKISALAEETASLWHAVDRPVPDCAVVWLHGQGETEVYWQELFEMYEIFDLSELGEVRWIMPRALPSPCTTRGGALTFQWFDTPEFPVCIIVPGVPDRPRKDEDPDEIRKAVDCVHEAVIALEVEGVPAEHIIIAGFGQGGALAVHAALSYPKHLAGCALLSGYLPCFKSMLTPAVTPAGKTLEILWLHGIHDAVVQTDAATAQGKALIELGVPLDFRLSLDFGHETTEEELKVFRAWLVKEFNHSFEKYGRKAKGNDETESPEMAEDSSL